MADTPQVNQAQLLDDLTSLQQSDPAPLQSSTSDVKSETTNVSEADKPSLYNQNNPAKNSTQDMTAVLLDSQLNTSELNTSEINSYETNMNEVVAEQTTIVSVDLINNQDVIVENQLQTSQINPVSNPVNSNDTGVSPTVESTTTNDPVAVATVTDTTTVINQTNVPVVEENAISPDDVPAIPTTPTPQEPTFRTVLSVVSEEIIDKVTDISNPVITTIFKDDTTRVNDLENNKEIITVTRTYTDTGVITTTITTTTTPVTKTNYSDGTVETVIGIPVINTVITDDSTVTNRQEVVSTTLEDPTLVITYETVIDSVTGTTTVETTYTDSTIRENDLTNNKEIVTVTREYTDVKTTPTTETTTVTPVYTYTYTDGTVEVDRGTPTASDITTYNVVTETREEIVSNTFEDPTLVITYETVIEAVTGETITETTFNDTTTRENDLLANKETVTVTREYTDVKTTPTTETTITTPIHTYTYTDGTVEVEKQTPVISDDTTYNVVTETRVDVIFTGTEEPTIVTTFETVVESVTGETTTETTFEDSTVRENDLTNNKEIVTVTREYTDVKTTPTVETTTVTPVYIITYTDGTVETERGTAVVSDITNNDVVTETREEIVSTTLEDPALAITYETVVDSVTGETTVETTYTDSTIRENDLTNNKEIVTVTREYTDVKTTPTTETTTITPIYTYTYSDGTVEVERQTPNANEITTYNTITETRQDVISTGTEEPTIVTTYETLIESVTGDTTTETTFSDSTVRVNDLDNNKEVVTVTREYTDVKTTPTVETTTITPIYTITYTDGTVETERGTPVSNDITTYNVVTETREETVSTSLEDPALVITYETVIDSVTGSTVVETTYSDLTTRVNDLESNKETVTVTRTYTDVKTTPTTETTTITPVYTYTYTDGTVEVERQTPTVSDETTYDTITEIRQDIISTGMEEPVITTTYETIINSVTGETTTETTFNDNTVRVNDLVNNRELVTVTRNYTDVKTTPTTETTTVTPIYTITYTDGTVEVERGTASINEFITYGVITELRNDIIDQLIEYPTVVTTYEVVENVVVGDPQTTTDADDPVVDRVRDPDNSRWVSTTTVDYLDTTRIDTTKTTTTTPINTITYSDGVVEIEYGSVSIDTSTTTNITTEQRREIINIEYEAFQNNGFGNGDQEAPGGSGDNNNAENNQEEPIDPLKDIILDLDSMLPNGNKIKEENLSDWVRMFEDIDGSATLQVDSHSGKKGASSGWTDVIDIPDVDGRDAFFNPENQTVDFSNNAGDWQVHQEPPPNLI